MNRVGKPGFYYGYVVVALAFIILMVTYGSMYTFGIFFKPLLGEFGWTRAALSGAVSLYMVIQGFFSIITGRLNDKLGPRVVISGCGFLVG